MAPLIRAEWYIAPSVFPTIKQCYGQPWRR